MTFHPNDITLLVATSANFFYSKKNLISCFDKTLFHDEKTRENVNGSYNTV